MEQNEIADDEQIVLESDVSDDLETPKQRLSRKEKKEKRLNNRYFSEHDIRYRGPFSYRYLRMIAWVSMAAGQMYTMETLAEKFVKGGVLSDGLDIFMIILSALSVPLFIIATFATILNKGKTIRSVLIFYGAAAFGLAMGVIFLYYRYVVHLFTKLGADNAALSDINLTLGSKLEINVFVDLFMLSLFYFFVMYNPKKFFQGKKHYLFRSFSALPILVSIVSFSVKAFSRLGYFSIPIALNPFLTTKPFPIYILFIVLTLWLKRREKQIIKLGGSADNIVKYENSNRNSLAFSIFTSILCLVISAVDILLYVIVLTTDNLMVIFYLTAFDVGQCSGLFIAIPILLLFSYSRRHKSSSIDIIIVLAGIGLMVLGTVEMSYKLLIAMVESSPADAAGAFLCLM